MFGTDNGRISEKTVENTLELTKYIMKKYGIDADHVVRHYYASRKDCPSVFHDNNWLDGGILRIDYQIVE
ncbi:N-acetylmuramoyl-L-alanine amidase family 2 protein [[Clostridium] sordellii]|uniref:N-acetylmuramoyl-L-alanine amidase family 2 protein n=1 Tax=Paraclostridium sordellii TaxID=1505 RepID=A0A9P1PB75_PARSO|nr:N-acetylmuramoyl-L-alanine amidase family 2 protein [[Clostridium] sordellii] [Paeniclostridium sordellii]